MVNTKFEAYKLKRELKRSGRIFTFTRRKLNKYKEPENDSDIVGSLKGIYHESLRDPRGNISVITTETTQHRSKRMPMILCLFEDVDLLKLKVGDELLLNSDKMRVNGIINVQNWNIIADISLEVIDDVNKT